MSIIFLFQATQYGQTVLFQTIQSCRRTVFVDTQLNVKEFLFRTIQFSISTQFTSIWTKGPHQVLPFWARVNLGAIAMKRFSGFSKAPASLEPHHQIVQNHTRTLVGGGVGFLHLCRSAVGVFYNSSRLGKVDEVEKNIEWVITQ